MAEYCDSFHFSEDNQDHFVMMPEEDAFEINTGTPGPQGDPGEGVPPGGTTGQVLKKASNDDYDTVWASGGGGGGSVQSDWDQTDPTADDYIKNKPTIPAAQIQSDWNQSNSNAKDYIKNKPTIPAAQVNADWTAASGVAQILHKPTLGTAAAKDVPASGDAGSSQVVLGSDSRLTDARNAADVSAWAKAATKPSYDAGEVAYDDSLTYAADTVGEGLTSLKTSLNQLIQESAFEIVEENGEFKLYWYGAQRECPYTIVYENGVYNLYFNYTTA